MLKEFVNLEKVFKGQSEDYITILDRIGVELEDYTKLTKEKNSIRVLFGPSFSIYPPSFIHDRILSYALKMRGADIFPIYCDALQSIECNVYGGVWGG